MTGTITIIFFVLGAFCMLVSSIGLIHFPDLYTRMHAPTKATSFAI